MNWDLHSWVRFRKDSFTCRRYHALQGLLIWRKTTSLDPGSNPGTKQIFYKTMMSKHYLFHPFDLVSPMCDYSSWQWTSSRDRHAFQATEDCKLVCLRTSISSLHYLRPVRNVWNNELFISGTDAYICSEWIEISTHFSAWTMQLTPASFTSKMTGVFQDLMLMVSWHQLGWDKMRLLTES